ncbi:hypothetical protein JL101_000030 [Skermanella rosea]|uniref:hypothetical protein n=1 Tax=Skermanella rosea TaxID=1817965 RepID=UPI0019338F67|nr:hypothetical protein [Skermanella rosea]UEM03873.1 hypothetical protein JL101_000030 [Skermanella rosea]
MRSGIGKITRTLVACLLLLALPGAAFVSDAAFAHHLRHGCDHAAGHAAGPEGHRAGTAATLPSDADGGDCAGRGDAGLKCRIGLQCMTVTGGLPASFVLPLVRLPAGSELPPAAALLDGIDPAPVLHPPRPLA